MNRCAGDNPGEPIATDPPYILEVGCGDGRLAELLVDQGFRLLGVDSEPSAVDLARARGLAAECAEWPNLDLPTATRFDLILFTRSLHHISDVEGGVRRARELLRPRGSLVVEDLALEDMDHSWAAWLAERARSREVRGEFRPDRFLEALMSSPSPLGEWRREHDHEPALHDARAMREAVEANFVDVRQARVPYLFRYLLDGLEQTAGGASLAHEEQRREVDAAEGHLRPLIGARFVARVP
ncbi:MAG: class I SAM-dependent methyltransferase [Candidatus Eisenbacteria bacterium]|nr:class I SAM-dependent methyltransferase [Candidatus Eisenbacteria bacterium]